MAKQARPREASISVKMLKDVFRTSEAWSQNKDGPEERERKGIKEKGFNFFENTSNK
jgi:hypothetical protein